MSINIFPIKLKALRISKDISQIKLAKDTGITKQSLSLYENGLREPGLYTLVKLAEYFDVPLDFFVNDDLKKSNETLSIDTNILKNEIATLKKIISSMENELNNCQLSIANLEYSIDLLNNIDNTKEDTENFNEEYAEELVPNITDINSYREAKEEIIEEAEEEIEYRHIIDRGCIPAGKLRETFADDFGTFEVPENKLSRKKDYYILTISGDSMDKYYPDGEKILVEDTINVNYGDIVIARVNYSATVKKLSRHEEGIELVPLSNNPEHKPQIITDEDFCIKGKVLGLLSEFLN